MNQTQLIGRLTNEPDVYAMADGSQTCAFTIAVSRDYKNANGDYDADFIRCKAFKKTAEYIIKYLHKGFMIGVVGQIRTGSYENAKGEKVYTTDIFVNNVKNLERKHSDDTNNDDSVDDFNNQVCISDDELPF